MALPLVYPLLLIAVIKSCNCDGYNPNRDLQNPAAQIGDLLKPPPPPPMKNLLPVPFHSSGKDPRQSWDSTRYNYQPQPPPPPNLKSIAPSNLKIPSGFHKQYNLNFGNNNHTSTFKFVPPPQPFTTTASPNVFQKVSGWLFSPYATYQTMSASSYQPTYQPLQSIPKECNPCNLVPWMPVIRYNNDLKNNNKNVQSNFITSPYPSTFASSPLSSPSLSTPSPTYGPPSPTAFAPHAHFNHDIVQFYPKPFQSHHQSGHFASFTPSISHAVYGHTLSHSFLGAPAHSDLGSTYGPPSPTHTVAVPSHSPPTSTLGDHSSTYPIPSSYGIPSQASWEPSPSYAPPVTPYDRERLNPTYGPPSAQYGVPLPFPKAPVSSTPGPISNQYSSPVPLPEYNTPNHETSSFNNDFEFNFDDIKGVLSGASQHLPKVEHPASFKNSYGEDINPSDFDVLFPVSATAAASIKIKTQVLPNATNPKDINQNLALSNPAPFTLNRGRNIHTLQPVALPNLSISPLPPIFNARPFRPPKLEENIIQKLNSMQNSNRVKIQQSLPIAEFTQSIDYPPTIIKPSVIDIEDLRKSNHTKAYRNIFSPQVSDHVTDISSQASEEHTSATKAQDVSFESTGTDFVNDISNDLPMDLNQNQHFPNNHKHQFTDLRGMEYQDVDKFRTENNLQNIDSPLLYLKPSAPHKKFENFVTTLKSQSNAGGDYEIYDDLPTTLSPQYTTTQTTSWDESRNDYTDTSPSKDQKEGKPKIVQIIVPYTTNKETSSEDDHESKIFDEDYLPRKVPHPSEVPYTNTVSESYVTVSTTNRPSTAATDQYESILNDLYDVKEPPFDIVKLQHTIDDWTEQEYSKRTQNPGKLRDNAKYAKKIPDEFFTTISPNNNYDSNNFFEWYDHEGESSIINRSILKMNNDTFGKPYKPKDRFKSRPDNKKEENHLSDNHKLHIYTAASSFRSTTSTQRPWDTIQTSISPLTKEKVYVVTSKPWLDAPNTTKEWFKVNTFDSSEAGDEISNYDDTIFKSPRFSKRPSYGFTSIDKSDSVHSDSSYGFSKNWHQKINNLDTEVRTTTVEPGSSQDIPSINMDELFDDTTTENPQKD